MKSIYEKKKSTSHIVFSGKRGKDFPLRSGARQWCPFHHAIQDSTEILLRAVRQHKKIKGMQIRMEEVKPPLVSDVTISYMKKSKRIHTLQPDQVYIQIQQSFRV